MAAGPQGEDNDFDYDDFERQFRARAREDELRSRTVVSRTRPDVDDDEGERMSENQKSAISFVVCLGIIFGIAVASQNWLTGFSAIEPDAQFEPMAPTQELVDYRTKKISSSDGPGVTKVDLNALMSD